MSKIKIFLLFFVSIAVLSSCDSRARQEKRADSLINDIREFIKSENYSQAQIYIDSIHKTYPLLVDKRKSAAALKDTITRRESAKTLDYCSNIYPQKKQELDSLQKNFRFEKNEKYQEFGNYVYKTQITEQNTDRNYLKCYVDENGDFYLISNVTGTKIEQYCIKVISGDEFALSDSIGIDKGIFHNFSDGGTYWESLTYKNDGGMPVAKFIADHSADRIKVELIGKRKYFYIMNEQDKKAITETIKFWVVKKDVLELEKKIKIATIKIGNIKLRYQ
ncbi:MAG: hypothetical protein PHH37_03930 [Paludibacter sp.]|nr:hypothetical protein [Paludibacter sp.]